MPLVEVIPCTTISEQTTATTVELVKRQDKAPIMVRDKASLYANRILAPHINEVIRMLTEGERVETIDAALVKSGFPVGPIRLLDEAGIDMGAKIIPVLGTIYGRHFSAFANIVTSILNNDRKGKKDGRGFYPYGVKGHESKKQVDPATRTSTGVQGQGRLIAAQIAERCVMLMLNEAARCFDERIVRSVHDDDIDAVFGIGFPPFLGDPFRYMDSLGMGKVIAVLQRLIAQYGSWFTLCGQLLQMAERSKRFRSIGETDLNP